MKTNGNSTIDCNVIASAIEDRLDGEAAREAAAIEATRISSERIVQRRAPPNDQQEIARLVRMIRPVQCPACSGRGYFETEERASVSSYQFVERNTATAMPQFGLEKLADQVRTVPPPSTKIRNLCELCEGGARAVLSTLMQELLRALVGSLRADERAAAAVAAEIKAFNTQARTSLAERAKAHEAARLRHEEADRIEREALERAAALRNPAAGGEVQS